jgi:hypothetical protein
LYHRAANSTTARPSNPSGTFRFQVSSRNCSWFSHWVTQHTWDLLLNTVVYSRNHKSPPMDPILGQTNPIQTSNLTLHLVSLL